MILNKEIMETVAEKAHLFWEERLSGGEDGGDLSIKDKDTDLIYILPRPNDTLKIPNWGVIKPEDVVVVDLDGNIISNTGIMPTVELPTHLCIYKERKDVGAVVHSHGEWSTIFAICGKDIPPYIAEQLVYLGGETKCADYGVIGSTKLGENIVKALGKNGSALMRNHGAVAVGKDIDEAFMRAVLLERSAQKVLFSQLLGGAQVLDPNNLLDPMYLDENGKLIL